MGYGVRRIDAPMPKPALWFPVHEGHRPLSWMSRSGAEAVRGRRAQRPGPSDPRWWSEARWCEGQRTWSCAAALDGRSDPTLSAAPGGPRPPGDAQRRASIQQPPEAPVWKGSGEFAGVGRVVVG